MTHSSHDDDRSPISLSTAGPPAGGSRAPDRVAPMLAADAPEPFDSPDYIFELMWGGLRAVAHVRGGRVRLQARNGLDLTPYFPELEAIPQRLRARECVLDGEIVALDADARPSFDLLRPRMQAMAAALEAGALEVDALPLEFRLKKLPGQLTYQAFDLLWIDGRSLMDRPLWQRKNRLHDAVRSSADIAAVDFVDDEGVAFFEAVVERKLEGIVAKQKVSAYMPGKRSKAWLQVRALQSGDFVVGGYAFGGTRRKGDVFSQILLGGYSEGRFEYVGSVSGGLSDPEARALVSQLERLHMPESPFHDPPPIARLIFWTKPEVVCHVRFSEWTRDGYLRFPIFSALRPDLSPGDCQLD